MGSSKESNEGGFWSEVNSDIGPMKAASQNDSMEQNNADGAANHQESDKEAMANISSLNTAWKDKVPDDFIQFRDTIDGAKILYIFCTGLYLLMTGTDGDATPLTPLPHQRWPLVLIAIVGLLHFVVSRQTRQVRWYQQEMTLVFYRHGIFGASSQIVEYAVQLDPQDRLELKSETRIEYDYDADGDQTTHRITTYWVERFRGDQQMDFSTQDWNKKRTLNQLIDFVHSKLQQ